MVVRESFAFREAASCDSACSISSANTKMFGRSCTQSISVFLHERLFGLPCAFSSIRSRLSWARSWPHGRYRPRETGASAIYPSRRATPLAGQRLEHRFRETLNSVVATASHDGCDGARSGELALDAAVKHRLDNTSDPSSHKRVESHPLAFSLRVGIRPQEVAASRPDE
jgi:hypothetical protein